MSQPAPPASSLATRRAAAGPAHVVHPLAPIVAADARVLILGTMPSPASREACFYYGHPRNRFWPVLAAVLGQEDPGTAQGRTQLVLDHRLALWDVLASCDIVGASDASIANPRPNDIAGLVAGTSIAHIFTTGATAWRYYHRLCEPATRLAATRLPSTSPANAAWRLDDLIAAYQSVRLALEEPLL